jgi:RNA recognition motif-containing protein
MIFWYSGSAKDTRGTAFVVYDDIYDAKTAVDHLSGFNVANRYLIVLYYNTSKATKKVSPHCCTPPQIFRPSSLIINAVAGSRHQGLHNKEVE